MLHTIAMGTWGPGPFDNDAAADFLEEAQSSPSRSVAKGLQVVVKAPLGQYIDVDTGGAAWAAAELVALAFGYGDTAAYNDRILDIAAKLKPIEELRLLALGALLRVADRTTSELASLWHEGGDGNRFEAALAQLRERLEAAGAGPRELPKPKAGDVICFPREPNSNELIVVQVIGPGEVAVIGGTSPNEAAALESVKTRSARRVLAPVHKLLRRGRVLGNVPVRKNLRGKKLYACESGAIEDYFLATAKARYVRSVTYEDARDHDVLRRYGEDDLRAIALGTRPVERVRSPEKREAELRERNATKWAARREVTTPGPFGDITSLVRILELIEHRGLEGMIWYFHVQAAGMVRSPRPCEQEERLSFAFAGLVALWRKTWPREIWPATLAGRLPEPPDEELMSQALDAARVLADQVLMPDAELQQIWASSPDQGVELREVVALLQKALS